MSICIHSHIDTLCHIHTHLYRSGQSVRGCREHCISAEDKSPSTSVLDMILKI